MVIFHFAIQRDAAFFKLSFGTVTSVTCHGVTKNLRDVTKILARKMLRVRARLRDIKTIKAVVDLMRFKGPFGAEGNLRETRRRDVTRNKSGLLPLPAGKIQRKNFRSLAKINEELKIDQMSLILN